MEITKATFDGFMDGIVAHDPPFSDDVSLKLLKHPFTPGLDFVFDPDDEADFDGYGAGKTTAGIEWGYDPNTMNGIITATPPVGGFHWETATDASLPQTIYGFILFNGNDTVAIAGQLFDTPVELTAANQIVDVPLAQITALPSAFL